MNLCDLELGNDFLKMTPKTQATKEVKKLHFIKLMALSLPLSPSLSLSLPLSFRLILWSAGALWVHFPAWASKTLSRRCPAPSPQREGAWGLREQSKPRAGALLAFCVNQGISASFSLLYFLIDQLQTTRFWCIKGPQQIIIRECDMKRILQSLRFI